MGTDKDKPKLTEEEKRALKEKLKIKKEQQIVQK